MTNTYKTQKAFPPVGANDETCSRPEYACVSIVAMNGARYYRLTLQNAFMLVVGDCQLMVGWWCGCDRFGFRHVIVVLHDGCAAKSGMQPVPVV
jgi:hypothetical protein